MQSAIINDAVKLFGDKIIIGGARVNCFGMQYKKRFLLWLMHHFNVRMNYCNNADHVSVSGTKPSSVVLLSSIKWIKTMVFLDCMHDTLHCSSGWDDAEAWAEMLSCPCLCIIPTWIVNIILILWNKFNHKIILFLAHLSQRLKWAIVIAHRPSSVRPSVRPSVVVVRKLSHFQLLLQNCLMDFDETW